MATVASTRPAIPLTIAPLMLAVAMFGVSLVVHADGGPNPLEIADNYVLASVAVCITSIFIFAFVHVAKMAREKADNPIRSVIDKLKPQLPMLWLPAVILPLFLAGYTTTKMAIPVVVGFRYDGLFADIDSALFGTDPWRLTHLLIGKPGSQLIELVYGPMWIAVLAYSKSLVALFAERRLTIVFFTAMMLTWFLGGFISAYLLSSAGPIFTDLNGLEQRFIPLRSSLRDISPNSYFLSGANYLEEGSAAGRAYPGGGISAMPSMHIGACVIYCLAARESRWFVPSLMFLALVSIGSIYSGFHYAVDGLVAAAIAIFSWRLAERWMRFRHE